MSLATEAESLRSQGLGSRRIAERLNVSRHAVRRALASSVPYVPTVGSVRTEPVSVTVKEAEGKASVVLPAGATLGDIDALLRDRGLDPDDWVVTHVVTNKWEALASGGGPGGKPVIVDLKQLKVSLVAKVSIVGPAVEVAKRHVPKLKLPEPTDGKLVVILGDQQAPYHDTELHRVVLDWLAEMLPHEMVLTGDTMDLPGISRHRDRLRWNAPVQECVNSAYGLLSDYVDASPKTHRRKLIGNHDYRLMTELMDRAERMAGVRPADIQGQPEATHLYSVKRLLHLDALGIELVGDEFEDWRKAEVTLARGVSVRHEPPTKESTKRVTRSAVFSGHDHRQGISSITTYDEDDRMFVRDTIHVGCLCLVPDGLGYAVRPDWQAGFATATIFPDGSHSADLATWRDGVLTWRGERWS